MTLHDDRCMTPSRVSRYRFSLRFNDWKKISHQGNQKSSRSDAGMQSRVQELDSGQPK
ncbi:hypothetical protein PILCRDRAFT_813407 [Piloderma croceum F 1598]|uniref:Uncharacterized protein n=1 Tax=Piloderma croceum (strain F 1598) TaxID=765440 RepID=A0A0C3B509_PILCF|nr:hypothetical protein PILCRDRAFT_829793 [Piloderma croceum F 1598]KIM89467.1 hypothetical protein PILCRDRAFT_813407 [Piloderma croceum F 1598]